MCRRRLGYLGLDTLLQNFLIFKVLRPHRHFHLYNFYNDRREENWSYTVKKGCELCIQCFIKLLEALSTSRHQFLLFLRSSTETTPRFQKAGDKVGQKRLEMMKHESGGMVRR